MTYPLTSWQDSPSNVTPLTSSNLLLYNSAINDIDTRINSKQAQLVVTGVQTSNYTALVQQFVLVDTTSGSVTVTFPAAPPDGSMIGVKHVVRGGINTVSAQLGGADSFNTVSGPQTFTFADRSQGATFQYVASTAVWVAVAADVPASAATVRAIAMAMVLGAFVP